jgi:hypothetical protein
MMVVGKPASLFSPQIVTAIATIVFTLVIQGGALLIWGAKIDSRLSYVEAHESYQDNQIGAIDQGGSRRLGIIADRQVINEGRIASTERKMEELLVKFNQHLIDLQVQLKQQQQQDRYTKPEPH